MQFRVDPAKGVAPAFNTAALTAAIPAAFAQAQDPMIVPESAYDAAYGTDSPDNYVRIQDTQTSFTPNGSSSPVTIALQPKAIQELFEPTYGRMNATLGVELPNTTMINQTTIPLGYAEPYTESISAGDQAVPIGTSGDNTQIWKITHNGVDTHFIHFHLFNVQVLNRVGWDGMVKPPDPNELGWKDTVRMNPLEDTIVALRPITPQVPFGIPDSVRSVDVTRPPTAMISTFDATTGNAITVPNTPVNYGWEYVWHCHILGHEENDMMRPIRFDVPKLLAQAPVLAVASSSQGLSLSWSDGTPVTIPYGQPGASWGDFSAEIGYRIERAETSPIAVPYAEIGTALANHATYLDTAAAPGATYTYKVTAYNAAGDAASNEVTGSLVPTVPGPPTDVTAVAGNASAVVCVDGSRRGRSNASGQRLHRDVVAGRARLRHQRSAHLPGFRSRQRHGLYIRGYRFQCTWSGARVCEVRACDPGYCSSPAIEGEGRSGSRFSRRHLDGPRQPSYRDHGIHGQCLRVGRSDMPDNGASWMHRFRPGQRNLLHLHGHGQEQLWQ